MKKRVIAAAAAIAALGYGLSAVGAETLVRFEGGIGVHPVANTGVV